MIIRACLASDAAAIAAAVWQAKKAESQSNSSISPADEHSRWKLEGRREQLDHLP